MIIRCPQCEHTRSINASKIPSTAELATCPKCKHRFRFRTLRHSAEAPAPQEAPPPRQRVAAPPPGQEIIRPQSAIRESAEQTDIWDAVDALHDRWQAQLDQHVTEVETPRPSATATAQTATARTATGKTDPGRTQPHGPRQGTTGAQDATRLPEHGKKRASARASGTTPGMTPGATGKPLDGDRVQARAAATPHVASSTPEQRQDAKRDVSIGQDAPAPFLPHPDGVSAHAWEARESPRPGSAHSEPFRPEPPQQDENSFKKGMPVAFPYADGGVNPEERVEHDMQMLRQEQPARPMRDLGKLREFPDNESHDEEPAEKEGGVPWENPTLYGWGKGFIRTVREAMFNAPVFFAGINTDGSLAPGYLFFLILGYISIIATVAWSQAAALFLPGTAALPGAPVALPVLLLLAPIALGLMLLFVTGFIRIVVGIFAPGKAPFPVTYRVVGYSVAPFILSVVPFIGPGIGALWFLASLILGCRHALGLSWGLALTAPLFPAAALLGGLFWYFL